VISVSGLAKSFSSEAGSFHAVDGIQFEVPAGKLMTLLGPSGCGKTTTLRCLAGLERPNRGKIAVAGKTVVSTEEGIFIPVHKRKIGMVFQSYAIWPHMTVIENVSYPLEEMKIGQKEKTERARKALTLVGLAELGNRLAPNLSGGQQQRVALARALVAEPEVLLLDEPLSNLDAKLRETMRSELRALQQKLGITTVYVTHDQIEALSMSDFVAVMNQGKLIEQGTPRELYERPKSRFTAEFLGVTNFLMSCPHGCQLDKAAPLQNGGFLSIRPEDIEVSAVTAGPKQATWAGEVKKSIFLGSHTYCEIAVGEQIVKANVHHSLPLNLGDKVWVGWDPRLCSLVTCENS
jgi:ABC-type Fe3+/spermidine/putrescine transport system ATPase subunit